MSSDDYWEPDSDTEFFKDTVEESERAKGRLPKESGEQTKLGSTPVAEGPRHQTQRSAAPVIAQALKRQASSYESIGPSRAAVAPVMPSNLPWMGTDVHIQMYMEDILAQR